ncbi:MAG TPA: PAS domain-containing protein [Burkholderiaceae bacterium]|nr:PAS domain-containing protein [Burkholderiaceae bacterium]
MSGTRPKKNISPLAYTAPYSLAKWLVWAVPLVATMIIATIWLFTVQFLNTERDQIEQQAFARVRGLTHAFEEQTQRTLQQIDQITKFIAYDFEHRGEDVDLNGLVRNGLTGQSGLFAVSILDAKGDLIASTFSNATANLADREHFKVHVDGKFSGLFISQPVMGRVTKRWSVQLSRRLQTANGAFAGVVVVSIDPAYLTQAYSEAQFGKYGVLTVIGLDWVVRARRTGDQLKFGDLAGKTLSQYVTKSPEGVYVANSSLDNIKRLIAYKTLDGYPLVLSTGLAEEEVFSDFVARRAQTYAFLGGATALLMIGLAWFAWLLHRLRQSQLQTLREHVRFEAASDASLDAFYILRAVRDEHDEIIDFEFAHCNERGAALVSMSKSAVIGLRLLETFPINYDPRFFKTYCEVVRTRRAVEDEFLIDAPSKKQVWLRHQVVAVDDGIAITTRDVTALHLRDEEMASAHQAIMNAEKRIRTLADNLPALVAYVDKDERYRFTNAYYQTIYGVAPDLYLGKTLAESMGAESYEDVAHEVAAALRGERRRFEQHAIEHGEDVHLLVDYIPDIDRHGVAGFYVMVMDITARKNAELRQAESEQRLRRILAHAPDAFIGLDTEGRIEEWNRQAEKTFGWEREEVMGRLLSDVIIPHEYRDAHEAGMRKFVRTGEGAVLNKRLELHALHRDGHSIPIELSIAAVRQKHGFAAIAFLHDISHRRDAEQRLRDSERRLKSITDNIPALISHIDANETYLFANQHFERLLDISPESLIGRSLTQARDPEYLAQIREHVDAVLTGQRVAFESMLTLHGSLRHFQQNYVPDTQADGSVNGFYSVTIDITERIEQQRRLAASEKRLRDITDNLPVLISYIDKNERYRFCNGTYKSWLGVEPSDIIGMSVRETLSAAEYQAHKELLRRALTGERTEFDVESTPLGVHRHMHTIYLPDVSNDGVVEGIYALVTDISVMKAAEQQLAALVRTDSLTGLPNRHGFEERLADALARRRRNGHPIALFFLDVDRFKSINDTFGHRIGDLVLQEFARRLRLSVRATDTVARLAGDEFVVILEGLHGMVEPQLVARKIMAQIRQPFEIDDIHIDVSTSVGIAFQMHDEATPEELLSRADKALYVAKAAGRNTYHLEAA